MKYYCISSKKKLKVLIGRNVKIAIRKYQKRLFGIKSRHDYKNKENRFFNSVVW